MKFNFFRKPVKVHVPDMPVIVPVVPTVPKIVPPDTNYQFIEPNTDRFLVPKDVKDIHTLFNYLVNRTINKGTDAADAALGEMDSFIKNNEDLLDLRHIPGLVCTDGLYMIEKGTDEDEYKFLMIKLNSWKNASQSPIFNRDEGVAFIKNKLKKEAIEYIDSLSAEEVEQYIFDEILGYKLDYVVSDCCAWRWPTNTINRVGTPEYLESYAIRFNDDYNFADDVVAALNDEIDEARKMFRHKQLFAIINNHVYIVSSIGEGHIIYDVKHIEHLWDKIYWQHRYPHPDHKEELDALKSKEEAVLSSKEIPYISKEFKIKFIGL